MMNQKLIHRLPEIFRAFIKFLLVTLILIPFLRIFQFFLISNVHAVTEGLAGIEGLGIIQDMSLWISILILLLIPYILISLINRSAGIIFLTLVFVLGLISELSLFYYFLFALNLLDHIVFSYTIDELKMIAFSSGDVNLKILIPYISGVVIIILAVYFGQKIKVRKWKYLVIPVVVFSGIILILKYTLLPTFTGTYEDYVRQNKTSYFLRKCFEYKMNSGGSNSDEEIRLAAMRFHGMFPGRGYAGPMYPFLHSGQQENVLAPFFNLGDEKPNLVFVIVESLSTCFMGNDSYCGSYTPFLDSLAQKSLYWPNFLSSSEKTFNVLPGLFGSMPPFNHNLIANTGSFPQHLTSIRLLMENGYTPSFYYGGWTGFDNMAEFFQAQGMKNYDFQFGKKYNKILIDENYVWGHQDDEVYSRSFEIIDSLKNNPRMDIYLTLSTHEPFSPPDIDHYLSLASERAKMNGKRKLSEKYILRNLNIFASIMYTDKALADFFREYEKRPDFKNTIFIITGDHGMTELNMRHYCEIERFHIPMLIYSPMLKRSRLMPAVSSHLDLTPSLLALINGRYGITERKYSAWMGEGLDTANEFRCVKDIAFLGGNRDITEYLHGTKFLYQNTMYDLLPGMYLKKSRNNDKQSLETLSQLVKDLTLLSAYVVKQDRLMPYSVYAGRYVKTVEIPVKDTTYFSQADSVSGFRDLVRNLKISSEIKQIELKISMEVFAKQDKMPQVVFDLCDTTGKSLSWNAMNITRNGDCNRWVPCKASGAFDLSAIKAVKGEYKVKMYIWNNDRSVTMFRNPKIEMTGFLE